MENNDIEVEIEAPEPPAPDIEVTVDGHQEPPKEAKEEWVDIKDPAVQKKMNNLYKQVKMSDTRNKFLMDANEKALQRIEELESRFNQTDQAEAERVLNQRLQEARDEGDSQKEAKILQEIIDYKVSSKLSSQKQPEKVQQQPSYQELEPDLQYLHDLATSTDDNGQLAAPWIRADHPKHATALKLAAIYATDYHTEHGYVDIEEVMDKVTKEMARKTTVSKPNNRAPDPMKGSDLTRRPTQGKIKLSQAEVAMAAKLGVKVEDYAKWK